MRNRTSTPAHCRDDWAEIDSRWSPVELTRFWAIGELERGSLAFLRIEAGLGFPLGMLVERRH